MLRVIGLLVVFGSIPLFYLMARGSIAARRLCWFLIGLLPLVINSLHLDVSIVSWALWSGYAKGAIVSVLDSLAIAMILTTAEPNKARPLLAFYIIFFIGSGFATIFAPFLTASLFASWQLARCILLFFAVSKVASIPTRIPYIACGLAVGSIYQAAFCINERLHGAVQASGTMGHQNLLGMCTHFTLLLTIAAMLAGARPRLLALGTLAGVICVVLGGSRATTALAAAGMAALLILSVIRRPTARKMRIAGIGAVALAVGAPIGLSTLHTRFELAPLSTDYDERAAFERAARAMWADHPMGVGPNQYVMVSNSEKYAERAGVVWTEGSRSANVHNTYLLLGAETGYIGLGSYLLLLAAGLLTAWKLAWSKPRDEVGEYSLAVFVLLVVVAIHCFYEWIFVVWNVQYLFAIALGILAGLAKYDRARRSEWKLALRRRRGAPEAGAASAAPLGSGLIAGVRAAQA